MSKIPSLSCNKSKLRTTIKVLHRGYICYTAVIFIDVSILILFYRDVYELNIVYILFQAKS